MNTTLSPSATSCWVASEGPVLRLRLRGPDGQQLDSLLAMHAAPRQLGGNSRCTPGQESRQHRGVEVPNTAEVGALTDSTADELDAPSLGNAGAVDVTQPSPPGVYWSESDVGITSCEFAVPSSPATPTSNLWMNDLDLVASYGPADIGTCHGALHDNLMSEWFGLL